MQRVCVIAHVVWLEMLRRKDAYVLLILVAALLFYLMSLNVFGLNSAVRYLKDVGLLFTWLASWVLTAALAGRQLPQEERRGTVYPLLAKPLTRAELIVGKWAGSWLAAGAATLSFYLAVWLIVWLRGGAFDPLTFVQAFALHLVLLGIVAALALLLSARQNFDAALTLSLVVCAACFAVVPQVPMLLVKEKGIAADALLALYYALPHFELFDLRRRLVHDWGAAPWSTALGVMLYGALWTGVLLLLAWAAYRRKRFKRENAG